MKEKEYNELRLRLKGCGACTPMYSTLSKFERAWFSRIYEIIAELEKKLEQTEKDLTDYQFNYPKILDLEWQLQEVLEDNDNYQKENAELKEINEGYNRNRDKLIAMGFPTFKSCKEYSDKLTNLLKENITLKKQLEALSDDIPWNKLKDVSEVTKELTEAKEIIKDLLTLPFANNWEVYADVTSHLVRAEQFLKE